MIENIKKLVENYFSEIVSIRRHLHKHPELSFKEYKTSKYIKSILEAWNIEYTDDYVETGILAIVKGKNPDKNCIAIRADFDALPIQEENDVEYASVNNNVMHACGHDVHTSSMLGALKIITELKDSFEGTLKFIFQPAEEIIPGGAKQMIEEGVLENPNVNKIFAQHVFPDLEVGKVGFKPGMYMASTDEVHITIKGKGGHAALPEKYNNPIIASSHLIIALNDYFSKIKDFPCVFAIGYINAIGSTNVIPDEVKLKGTFRAMNETFRADSLQKMIEINNKIESDFNLSIDFHIKNGYPFLENDTVLTNNAFNLSKEYLGEENVIELPIRMTGEDFSYFALEKPSCFYRLGTRNENLGIVHGLHTSKFNVDENAIKIGMGLMAYIALKSI
jgi:amidohydrolase